MSEPAITEDQRDALQEIANMAMGQAATRLAQLFDAFIELSVPRVRTVAVSEAAHALREATGIDEPITVVRQGFRSAIKGEALVICPGSSVKQLHALMGDAHAGLPKGPAAGNELIFDVASVLTGACVVSILEQLGCSPIFSPPGLLGTQISLEDVFRPGVLAWTVALLVEVNLALEDRTFRVHMVMLMTDASIHYLGGALDALLVSL